MTIIGRIQIVKTFIIPIFLYRVSLISVNKEFMKDVNKIIFDFIWKGQDKVKRSALLSDIEDGGLKAPHLDSIIETQRVLCCKKLASDQASNWKKILLHYLEPVRGKFILYCDFHLTKLPIKLPAFYEECLKVLQNAPQQTTQVYRIKIDKIFQKLLCGTINLFVSGANLCILETSQKKEF